MSGSGNGPSPQYSHNNATTTGAGAWIDASAFTEDSCLEIVNTGDAVIKMECTLDINNPTMTQDVTQGGDADTHMFRLPAQVPYVRTNIVSISTGSVSSCLGRGFSDASVVSAQFPVNFSVPNTLV